LYVYNCPITDLTGTPEGLNNIVLQNCEKLTSLKGGPNKSCAQYYIYGCESLESLEYVSEVVGDFRCVDCPKITSLEGLKKVIDLRNKFARADKKIVDFILNEVEPIKKKLIHINSEIEDKKADLYAWAKLSNQAQDKIEMFLRENFASIEFSEEILEAKEEDYSPENWFYIARAKKMVAAQKFDYIEKLL
jgi:hypothetical protein